MKDTTHCGSCYNDFYNGRQNVSGSNCWSLKDAKLVIMYYIHKDTPMSGYQFAWTRCVDKKPSCYKGQSGLIYITKDRYDRLIKGKRENHAT